MTVPSRPQTATLSVVMIARDAAQWIIPTIDSVADLADEVVLIDYGSSDGTADVAKASGVKVFNSQWNADLSAIRNFAAAQATGKWILWLEAGEQMMPQQCAMIRTFIDNEADPHSVYTLLRELPPAADQLCGEQVRQIRLVPRELPLEFTGRVAESLKPSIAARGADVHHTDLRIHGSAASHDVDFKKQQAHRDLQLINIELEAERETVDLNLRAGAAWSDMGKLNRARESYRRAIDASERGSTEMLEAYYGLLSSYDGQSDHRQTQLNACLEALDVFPLDAQLLCAVGSYMLSDDRLELAARCYRLAVEHGQVNSEAWHLVEVGEVASSCLALTLQLLEEDEASQKVLEQAVEHYPQCTRLRRHLINLHIKHGRATEAHQEFDALPADYPHREPLRTAIRGGVLASQKNYQVARPYLETAYKSGCRDPLCLRWLTVTLLSTGDTPAAEKVLQEWDAIEPASAEIQAYMQALVTLSEPAESQEAQTPAEQTSPTSIGKTDSGRTIRVDHHPQQPTPELPTTPAHSPSSVPVE